MFASVTDAPDEPTIEPTIEPGPETAAVSASETAGQVAPVDLERVAADLDGVEAALRRLDDGTYWTDEVTGDEIPDRVLAADPVARRGDEG